MDSCTRRDDREKLAIVRRFLDLGMELKSFAREEGIDRNSQTNWVRKLKEGTLKK